MKRPAAAWLGIGAGVALIGLGGYWLWRSRTLHREAIELIGLLRLEQRSTVAEVGAGDGSMLSRVMQAAGVEGSVYATEIDSGRVAALQRLSAGRARWIVLQGTQHETALPPGCCDAIYLRHVYHHLTQPAAINASLFRALRPDGLLAIIDFPPNALWHLRLQRGGHGVTPSQVTAEITAAGFERVRMVDAWPGAGYCILFRKEKGRGR